jgi:hypothetical protein
MKDSSLDEDSLDERVITGSAAAARKKALKKEQWAEHVRVDANAGKELRALRDLLVHGREGLPHWNHGMSTLREQLVDAAVALLRSEATYRTWNAEGAEEDPFDPDADLEARLLAWRSRA